MSSYLAPLCSAVLALTSWITIVTGVFMIMYWGETLGGFLSLFIGCASFAIVISNSFFERGLLNYPEDR